MNAPNLLTCPFRHLPRAESATSAEAPAAPASPAEPEAPAAAAATAAPPANGEAPPAPEHQGGDQGTPDERADRPAPSGAHVRLPVAAPEYQGHQHARVADLEEAQDFLRQFYTEHPDQPVPFALRLRQVRRTVFDTGTYRHTPAELTFGARVAWRNSARCIGRLYWQSLRVQDCRGAVTAEEIHGRLVDHLRQATNGGKVRPLISVFAPDTPLSRAPRVWNSQLIRYAGYLRPNGRVTGDPGHIGFTETVRKLGWQPPGGSFDLLPLVIEAAGEGPALFELDRSDVLEVNLRHPHHPVLDELGLRWHAVPAISHMRLRIGGIDYPLAPFNGWYMGTEIGARTLSDTDRYNLLPLVAERLGLDTTREESLWRDRALVELNIAVLHSFRSAGVKISDHHTESRRFLTHLEREERHGRRVPADWSWIVPPLSGGATPVFHRYYDTVEQRPNFYLDADARARSEGGHSWPVDQAGAAAGDGGDAGEDTAVPAVPADARTGGVPPGDGCPVPQGLRHPGAAPG